MSINLILTYELQILFRKNKIFESFFEINSILTSLSKKQVFISVIHNQTLDILSCYTRIKCKKCTLTPMTINHRLNNLHTYSSHKNIIIDWKSLERQPKFFMTQCLKCAEFTHVADESYSLSSIFLCETNKHLYTSQNRLKSSIVSSINHETFIESTENISSGVWEMDMSKIGDNIKWHNAYLASYKKSAYKYACMVFSQYW